MKEEIIRSVHKLTNEVSKHSPAILMVMGLVGFGTTVVMACKATPKANEKIEELHKKQAELQEENRIVIQACTEVAVVAPVYLPSVLMGVVSGGCIIASYKINMKRTAALATAYSLTERTLKEYQKKVVETIGEKKEEKIRDSIKKDRVEKNPPVAGEIISTGDGDTLMMDAITGRYFRSNIDAVRKVESLLNRRLYTEMYVSLNDFFYEVGLPNCRVGDDIGWDTDHEIDLNFSTQLSQNNEPCIVVDYDYAPRYDYSKNM